MGKSHSLYVYWLIIGDIDIYALVVCRMYCAARYVVYILEIVPDQYTIPFGSKFDSVKISSARQPQPLSCFKEGPSESDLSVKAFSGLIPNAKFEKLRIPSFIKERLNLGVACCASEGSEPATDYCSQR